jgi:hypothetical protein
VSVTVPAELAQHQNVARVSQAAMVKIAERVRPRYETTVRRLATALKAAEAAQAEHRAMLAELREAGVTSSDLRPMLFAIRGPRGLEDALGDNVAAWLAEAREHNLLS